MIFNIPFTENKGRMERLPDICTGIFMLVATESDVTIHIVMPRKEGRMTIMKSILCSRCSTNTLMFLVFYQALTVPLMYQRAIDNAKKSIYLTNLAACLGDSICLAVYKVG